MNCRYAGLCAGICSVLIAVLALIAPARGQAITAAQIEADWLRQESLRNRPAQRVGKDVRPEDDAAGGCDGVKNGNWGFIPRTSRSPGGRSIWALPPIWVGWCSTIAASRP